MKKIFLCLAIALGIALGFSGCSNDSSKNEKQNTILSKDGDMASNFEITNKIPEDDEFRTIIENFGVLLVNKYTVFDDKTGFHFLVPKDDSAETIIGTKDATGKGRVICHKHPLDSYPDIHQVVVLADNGLYYTVMINDGSWPLEKPSVQIIYSGTYNPCNE